MRQLPKNSNLEDCNCVSGLKKKIGAQLTAVLRDFRLNEKSRSEEREREQGEGKKERKEE